MARAKEKIIKDTAERWLLTYADLMNLLLIFFIILYAMSQIDQQKYTQLAQALSVAFGQSSSANPLPGGAGGTSMLNLPGSAPKVVIPSRTEKQQMDEVKETVEDLIGKEGLKGDVEVSIQDRGVNIKISERVLFKSGSAVVEQESRKIIEKIGNTLRKIPGKRIGVEGHTDSDPIHNSLFSSNWDLSSARATNVLKILIDKGNIDKKNIFAAGYGEHHPIAPNNSEVNKSKNRRVNIVIFRSKFDNIQPEGLDKKE